MENLKISVSGIRGIIGESLLPETITKWVSSFGNLIGGGKILIASDTRFSNIMVKPITIGSLLATGCKVNDIGIVPTPTLALMVKELDANGGICITASHNPNQWNGLKFFSSDGLYLKKSLLTDLQHRVINNYPNYSKWNEIGQLAIDNTALEIHIQKILSIPYINITGIKKEKFRVACDCFNGAGSIVVPKLLEELGCVVIKQIYPVDGILPDDSEPRSENLANLGKLVLENQCHLGIAVDPDCDRLVLVDDRGNPLGEELSLALAVKLVTSKRRGPVVANISTSLATYDVSNSNNCPFYVSAIGERNVIDKMQEVGAIIGGEGNGGIILPEVHLTRDALTGIALTLQHLLETKSSLSVLKDTLPSYYLQKQKLLISGDNFTRALSNLKKTYYDWELNAIDGYHFKKEKKWFHLRASNTEPIARLFVETPTKQESIKLVNEIQSYLYGIGVIDH